MKTNFYIRWACHTLAYRNLFRALILSLSCILLPPELEASNPNLNESFFMADYNIGPGLDGMTVNIACGIVHNIYPADGDGQGPGVGYGPNEDYAVTFCNTDGGRVFFDYSAVFFGNVTAGDQVYVYDGASTASPIFPGLPLAMNDAGLIEPSFTSTGNCLTVRYVTDNTGGRGGFSGVASCVNTTTTNACTGNFFDTGGSGSSYGANEAQETVICADNGGNPIVTFSAFDIESNFDNFKVYDGANVSATLLGTFTGTNIGTGIFTGTGTCLTFEFTSDFSGENAGWEAAITCTPGGPPGIADYTIDQGGTETTCTGIFADSGDTNTNYGDNESESMTFCSDQDNQISFSFEHFNLAAGDVLEVFDGNSTGAMSLGTFSGAGEANSPGVVTSSGTCLTFEFTSNGSGNSTGWQASIKCTGTPPPTPVGGGWTGYDDVGSNCGGNEEIAGTVFEDIDQDGQRDGNEPIIANTMVALYDDGGLIGGPIATDANGDYSFTGLVAGNVYRVEFSIPDGLSEGVHGTGSSTAVQFVDAGSCNVNFGLADPSHYCNVEVNPTWMIPCYANGDPQHASNVNETGVASFEYTATGNSPHATYVNYVTAGAVGSTWGAAHDASNDMSYFGTLLKRHVGLGPGGIGAIYSHAEAAANNVAPIFYDFGAGAGTVASNATRFPGAGSMFGQEGPCGACDNVDPTTFGQVGKVGFGDLEMGPNNEFLYVTNLADRKVYKISTDNPTPGSATPLPGMPWLDNSICNNGVARPWALEFRRGKLYVGLICDASTSGCAIGSSCSDLTASIYSFDGSTWTSELSFPLDYYREAYATGSDYFVKWIDNWNTLEPFVANITDANFGQPILMDIEFDDDNSIIIGIGDRSGLQMGYQAPNPFDGSDDTSERIFAFGDILRASYNTGSDSYTLENNGSVGGLTTTNPNSTSGPGGKSFYWGDYFTGIGANRWQSGIGSLGLLPCSGEVMFPVADAIDYYSNGVIWMSNTNGAATRKLEVYQGSPNGNSANFAKGVGLGDIEFIREDPATIEVGNIVWWDENANGRQDPNEAGIPNVTLQLWKDDGGGSYSQVAETTTDGFGRYIFSSSTRNNGLSAENWSFSADNEVLYNTNYEIRIPNWSTEPGVDAYSTGLGYVSHLISSTENQGASGIERDNNGMDVSGNAVTSFTTGDPSENNHSYDFAFYGEGGCIAPDVIPTANTPCTGEDLELMAAVSGGQAPYTYSWTGPDGFSSSDQNPTVSSVDAALNAGSYNLTVTDALGCTEEICVEVYINELTIALAPTDANCGAGDGEIDLTITGESPFMINWDNDGTGDPNDDPEDLTGLSGGNYNVVVIDADGCQETESASIDESGAPTISATSIAPTCGLANGSIDLMVSGVAVTNIDWDNDGIMGDSDTEDLSGLSAGTYTVVVTGGGCEATLSVTIEDTPGPTSSFTQVNATCGNNNGSIDLTVDGGTMPYEYDWDGDMAFDDTEDLSGLSPGDYTVVVRDANGCTTTETVTITDAAGPTLTVDGMDETCTASNGSIELTVNGGTGPFTYDWDNDGTGDNDDPEDLTDLSAGTYTVIVTDDNGCTDQISVTLTNAPGITELQLVPTDASSCVQTDGSIALTVIGGTPPYAYDWDNDGEPAPDFDAEDLANVTSGTYSVTVTDANNCIAVGSATVGLETGAELDVVITDPTTCAETGSVDLTITGGVAPLSILWSNGETTEDLTGLDPGIYSVTVTEANGCEVSRNVSIRDIREPILSVVLVEPTCGMSNGEIDLSISDPDGMMTPLTITWDDGPTTEDRTGLAAGTYTVTVENGIGCSSTLIVNLNAALAPEIIISQTNESCTNANGAIDMTINGGTPGYTIDWDILPDMEDHTGLSAGTYNVTVTDAMGCVATASVEITDNAPPILAGVTSPEGCDLNDGSIDLMVDGIGPFTYDWSDDTYDGQEDLAGLAEGSYSVTITDVNGCMADAAFDVDYECVEILVSAGSTVFVDANNNGIQDAGEAGIPNVPVQLWSPGPDGMIGGVDDVQIMTGADGILGNADDVANGDVLTDADGNYIFTLLPEDDYYIIIPMGGFGMGNALEDYPLSSNTSSGTFAGETDPDDNADNDDEGLQAGGSGMEVTSGIFTLTADSEPTDDDPTTPENAQGNEQDNGDDDNGNMTFDFGFFAPVSLGDTTWVDTNMDGLQDMGEPFLEGVTVTLFRSDGTPVTLDAGGSPYTNTTMTNAMGFYEFTNLPPGDYYVVFDISTVAGSDFYTFTDNTGGDEENDSDADPNTGQSDNTGTINSGERFPDLDAGVVCNVTAEAGTDRTICSTEVVDLTTLGASFTPTGVTDFGATWTSSTGGTFDDGAGEFGVATSYTLSVADITAGEVVLTLTTDDPSMAPFNSAVCGPATDDVLIIILNVNCGTFPWDGSN